MGDDDENYPKRARVVVNRVTEAELENLQLIPRTAAGRPPGTLCPATLFFSANAALNALYSVNTGALFLVWNAGCDIAEVALLRSTGTGTSVPTLEIGGNQGQFAPILITPAAGEGGITFEDGTNNNNTAGNWAGLQAYLPADIAARAPWDSAGWYPVANAVQGNWALTVGDGTNNLDLGTSIGANWQVVDGICKFSIRFRLETNTITTSGATGVLRISLPFTSAAGATHQEAITVGDFAFVTLAAGTIMLASRLSGAADEIRVFRCATISSPVTIKIADLDDGVTPGNGRTQMRFSGQYFLGL